MWVSARLSVDCVDLLFSPREPSHRTTLRRENPDRSNASARLWRRHPASTVHGHGQNWVSAGVGLSVRRDRSGAGKQENAHRSLLQFTEPSPYHVMSSHCLEWSQLRHRFDCADSIPERCRSKRGQNGAVAGSKFGDVVAGTVSLPKCPSRRHRRMPGLTTPPAFDFTFRSSTPPCDFIQ